MPHGNSWRRSQVFVLAVAAVVCAGAASGPSAAQSMQERLQLCGTCHGEDGNSKMENTPSLAGQPELFIINQLILMRERLRPSEIMAPFVKDLKDDEIIALAAHYSKMQPELAGETVDQSLVPRGAMLARERRCGSCHLPTYEGREQMPRLAHQRIDYLIQSMKAYRDGKRSGIDTSMNDVMSGISDEDIRALAHYLASIR